MIYELWGSGHRYQYVRELVIALSEITQDIILVTSFSGNQSLEFHIHLEDISNLFLLDNEYNNNKPSLWSASGHLVSTVKKHDPKHVFIPTANGLIQYLGVRLFLGLGNPIKNTEIEIMLMSGGIFQGWRDKIWGKLWRFFTKRANCTVVHVLYPLQKQVYSSQVQKIADEILLTPEPVSADEDYGKITARKKLGIPTDGQYIVAVGGIDKRKGADYLLEAFFNIKDFKNIKLLLAGKMSMELKELLDNHYQEADKSNLIIFNDYLTEDQFTAAFLAADIICLPYRHSESSSGIAVRAAANRRPMLTSNTGWVGRTIPDFQLGITCDVTNPIEFSESIINTLDLAETYQLTKSGQFFINYHTVKNFRAHWMKRIRQRLNQPKDKNYIAWNSSN